MTQEEKREQCFSIIKDLRNKKGYIKGYGDKQDRVMDATHSPIRNIPRRLTNILKANKFLEQDGLILHLSGKGLSVITSNEIDLSK